MLLSLALIFMIGYLLAAVFKKLRLPELIGYLLSGMILGPYGMNVLDVSLLDIGSDIKQIALLIILTQAGLSLELDDFKKMGSKAVFMGFVPACFEITATFFLSKWLFNFNTIDALLLGTIIASASPAVIVPKMLKLMNEGYGIKKGVPQLVLTGASVDDVFNIVLFTSVLGFQANSSVSAMDFVMIPVTILLGIGLGIVMGFAVSYVFKRINTSIQIKTILVLSIGFVLLTVEPLVTNYLPFSALIAVMAMGVTLLKTYPEDAKAISHQLSRLWVGAQVLLFALVGAAVNLGYASKAGYLAIIMLVLALVVRSIGVMVCVSRSDFTRKEKIFAAIAGTPKATVQAAIGGIPLAMGLPNGEMILAISVIAILFTAPVGAMLIDLTYKKLLTQDI